MNDPLHPPPSRQRDNHGLDSSDRPSLAGLEHIRGELAPGADVGGVKDLEAIPSPSLRSSGTASGSAQHEEPAASRPDRGAAFALETQPSRMVWAFSLWQPWASLWVVSPRIKWNETRHWPPPLRYIGQRGLVHAAKTREGIRDAQDDPDLAAICRARFGDDWATSLPMGGFVGSIVLSSAERMAAGSVGRTPEDFICGNWAPGRYALLGQDPNVWPMVPARGQQGFWMVDRATLTGGPLEGQGKAVDDATRALASEGINPPESLHLGDVK